MTLKSTGNRPVWGSRWAFIIAAAGSAIGLGNIWKFPYITGVHGGGAFVLVYLLTIGLIGLPLMAAEIMVGKSTQLSPVAAFQALMGKNTAWKWLGVMSVVCAFTILAYYSVVAGWTLHYLFLSFQGGFSGRTPDEIYGMFSHLYGHGGLNLTWHLVVMVLVTFIVWRGVKGGIERATNIMMPALFVLLLILVVNSLLSDGAAQGLRFLFKPDFSKLGPVAILEAVGQGFFTLSLGMGAMITYGSYLSRESDVARPATVVVVLDTVVALLAGIVIFPIVFSYGFEPGSGPGLVFQTLPVVFSKMPGGAIFSVIFFLLLFLAALTSAISLLEVSVAYAVDSNLLPRKTASWITGLAIFSLGVLPALSGGALAKVTVPVLGRNIFDSMDYLATNWFLPMGGLFIAIFVGWVLPGDLRKTEFEFKAPVWWSYKIWLFSIRFVAPIGLIIVFLNRVGVLSLGGN